MASNSMSPLGSLSSLSQDKLVVFVPFDADEKWISRVKAQHPGIDVRWARSYKKKQRIAPESYPDELWEGATIVCCDWVPPPERLLKNVRYCQISSAGSDHWKGHATYQNQDVIFCNASGVHPPQIAEWVMGTWLAYQHHLYLYKEHMSDGNWDDTRREVQDSPGLRMGILGYGSIGRQVARLGQALGMEVFAYTRTEKATPESRRDKGYCVPGTGDPDGSIPSRWFCGASRDDVDHFLAQDLDMLVISLPLTELTRNLISTKQFAILSKKKTFLCNIARGPHVDTQALIQALETGQIRAAALDVTDPEPLPKGHPLWKAHNVFVSPHVSWLSTKYWHRVLDILVTNLEHLEKGESVINRVDRSVR